MKASPLAMVSRPAGFHQQTYYASVQLGREECLSPQGEKGARISIWIIIVVIFGQRPHHQGEFYFCRGIWK